MNTKDNTDKLYVWNSINNHQTDRHIILKDMNKDKTGYNHLDNVKSLSRMMMYTLPGNTLDIILVKLENKIKEIAKNNPEVLQDTFYISNLIRCTLNDLCDL